ncbi:hypothetical protein ACFXKI_45375 [Streptomyces mirabilis]|uniref:hypothetical protein n=1 Tax=Streptomyces mirabilis TaxID=68239 RepID=UPI0036917689
MDISDAGTRAHSPQSVLVSAVYLQGPPVAWEGSGPWRLPAVDGQHRHLAAANLLAADRVLNELRALSEEITDEAIQSRRLRDRLLATAEQDTGLPGMVSAPQRPRSSARPGWDLHRTDVLEYVTRGGTTDYELSYSHPRTWSEYSADAALFVRAALKAAAVQVWVFKLANLAVLALPSGEGYSCEGSGPPHEASPCGILRLAAPIVPGAPGVGSRTHQATMTLAA